MAVAVLSIAVSIRLRNINLVDEAIANKGMAPLFAPPVKSKYLSKTVTQLAHFTTLQFTSRLGRYDKCLAASPDITKV